MSIKNGPNRLLRFFYHRNLQIHILTLFLSLLILSCAIIISFFYQRNTHSITEFSKGTIQRVSERIHEKIQCLIQDLEHMPLLLASLLADYEEISPKNEKLLALLSILIREYPHLHGIFIGTPDGYLVETIDLSRFGRKHFYADTSEPLPPKTKFALRIIDPTTEPPKQTYYYKDASFRTLAFETHSTKFNPRKRPWYIGAEKSGKLYWSGIFTFKPVGKPGIAVSAPIYNSQGKFIGVAGTNVALSNLNKFLEGMKIGKTGKAFIIDSKGNVLVPDGKSNEEAKAAYEEFSRSHEQDFLFELKGKKYLGHASPFPVRREEWYLLLLAPLDDFFSGLFKARRETVWITLFIVLLAGLVALYFSKWVSRPIVLLTKEVDKIRNLDLASEQRVKSHIKEITLLDTAIASMRVMLRSFGRYVPKEIVRQLLEKGQEIALGGEKKKVTVFFSDIANFTPIAESYPIDDVMSGLANYFDFLSKIILASQGTIDKYIGDSIMAFWGAPTEVDSQAEKACTAALLCQKELHAFNSERRKINRPEFLTRIGIHIGDVIVGNIGTTERMNYTVMGDVVNESARLQQINKNYQTWIIVSEEVYKEVAHRFLLRPLDVVLVKGKKTKIKIYEILAKYHAEEEGLAPTAEQIELANAFTDAYELFAQGKTQEAKTILESLHTRFPEDYPTKLYLERIEKLKN